MKKTLDQPWYAVRSLFHDEANELYEERTVLIKAATQDEALDLAVSSLTSTP